MSRLGYFLWTVGLGLAACLIFWIFVFVDSGWGPNLTPLSIQLHTPLSVAGLFSAAMLSLSQVGHANSCHSPIPVQFCHPLQKRYIFRRGTMPTYVHFLYDPRR